MSNRNDHTETGSDIRVPEYNPDFVDSSKYADSENSSGNLNYYQRMQQLKRQRENASGYADRPGGSQSANASGADPYGPAPDNGWKDDTYSTAYEDDESDWDDGSGDDYDFGRPRKKRKRRRPLREEEPDSRKKKRRKKKKRHPVRRFLLVLLILVVLLFLAVWIALHIAFSHLNRVDPVADAAADTAAEAAGITPYSEKGVMNILLIGQDARDGETQTRSDTMIIASLNTKTHQIVLTSLMRDMYVPIAGYGSNKLNAAYAFGGMETLDETVQENFGIDINGNAVVDFDGFLTALTSVGNLDIELSQEEADYLNTYPGLGSSDDTVEGVVWNLQAGVNNMTPAQVLAYSRMRYVGNSDWDRTRRQRVVIQTAFSKLKKNPFRMLSVMNQAAPSITTDMTDSYLTRACFYALLCGSDMTTNTIPGDGMYTADNIDGMDVLVPDLTACHQALLRYIYQGDGTQGSIADDTDVNTDTVTNSGTTQDDYDAGTEESNPDAGQWQTSSDSSDSGTDAYSPEDYVTDPRTGEQALDLDHDGYPDYWGDTW